MQVSKVAVSGKFSDFSFGHKEINVTEKFPALSFYDANAQVYSAATLDSDMDSSRKLFLPHVPEQGSILDLGSGSCRDTIKFKNLGYQVSALDGAKNLAEVGTENVRKATGDTRFQVQTALFQDMQFPKQFDGIWSMGALDHVPPRDMINVLGRVVQSLKTGGILGISLRETTAKDIDGKPVFNYSRSLIDRVVSCLGQSMSVLSHTINADARGRQNLFWHFLMLTKRVN